MLEEVLVDLPILSWYYSHLPFQVLEYWHHNRQLLLHYRNLNKKPYQSFWLSRCSEKSRLSLENSRENFWFAIVAAVRFRARNCGVVGNFLSKHQCAGYISVHVSTYRFLKFDNHFTWRYIVRIFWMPGFKRKITLSGDTFNLCTVESHPASLVHLASRASQQAPYRVKVFLALWWW